MMENDPESERLKARGGSWRDQRVLFGSKVENGFPRLLRFREWIYSIASRRQEGSRRRHLIQ